jgi:hypothetical protein
MAGWTNMSDVSLTDFAYQAIEQAEQKRMHLMYIVIGCLLASLPGLGINAYFYMVESHSKGGLSSGSLELIAFLAMICLVLLAIGLQKFVLFRDLGNKLSQIELLEQTIYNEVILPKNVE